ncbi:MAG: hypothetical protein ACJ8ER_12210 [Allosphingosinicella sp.]
MQVFGLLSRTMMLPAAGFGLAIAAAQAAAPPAQPASDPIVVEGIRLPEKAARDRATQFVRSTGVAAGETPVARWVDPVCPQVLGLETVGERAAEARIRAIAAEAGIEVAPENCRPNIIVSFTPDPASVARAIEKREPWRLARLSPAARNSMLTGSAPVRWLYSTEVRGRHGDSQNVAGGATQTIPATHAGSGAGSSLGGDVPSLMHYDNSLLSTLTNRVLTSALVIIDTDQAMGKKLDTLAAYSALVALAEIRNVDARPEGSMLSLFETPAPPRDLTAQDKAFLRALYRLPLDRQAMLHRGLLVHDISEAITLE